MANISIRINKASIENKIAQAVKLKGEIIAYKRAYSLFYRAKNLLLRDFDKHPITQEINAGPRAINSSGTLGGYGNLFSFIGFEEGKDPIRDLREVIETINFRSTTFRNFTWFFRVSTPSQETIESASQMPWESGNSWATGIEKGITNLSFYLYKRSGKFGEYSRSRKGIQVAEEVNDDLVFERTQYLTKLFKDFRTRIINSSVNDI